MRWAEFAAGTRSVAPPFPARRHYPRAPMTLCDKCGSLVDEPAPDIEVRGLTLRPDRVLTHGSKQVRLRKFEASIFALLASHQCVTRETINRILFPDAKSKPLSVHLCYLRKRLREVDAPFGIELFPNFGYGLSAEGRASRCCERVATHC